MATNSFYEFTEQLPACEQFPMQTTLPNGVTYGQPLQGFIPPYLSVVEGHPNNSQVLIISAPGAVGKSTLAKALSSEKKALLWDLADAEEVGYGSLDAMLDYAVKSGLKADFLEWMTEGMQLIIIDALDEGRVKVNEISFRRLLENIGRLAKNSKKICFVLLGRTQIAETAWLVLVDQGINSSILSIEAFHREQANDYIANRVSPHSLTTSFVDCRDLIFQQLESSVTSSQGRESARDFIHYPPVLDVISILLDHEPNLLRLKNSLQSNPQNSSVTLIHDVIDRILEREQSQKVVPSISNKLRDVAEEVELSIIIESLYSKDEQCRRLLGSVLNMDIHATPSTLPASLTATYEQAISVALTEHPFLQGVDRFANSVFQSYLYARALRGDFGSDLQDRVTTVLLESGHLPTRLLAEFYLETADGHDFKNDIKPEHVGIIYDSLLSAESNRRHLRLTIEGSDPLDSDLVGSEFTEGEFELLSFGPEEELNIEVIPFVLCVNKESVMSFPRYIRNVHLTVPCTVELGSTTTESEVGPAVYISASRIRVSSESMVIGGKARPDEQKDPSIIFSALGFEAPLLGGNLTVYTNDVSVSWPNAERYPWTPFKRDHVRFQSDDKASLHRAYMRFKRIAIAFRSHGNTGLARIRAKIENQRTLQGELGRVLLDKLLEDGILRLGDGGNRYFWNTEKADALLEVSWQDFKKGECPEALRRYLNGFVTQNPELF